MPKAESFAVWQQWKCSGSFCQVNWSEQPKVLYFYYYSTPPKNMKERGSGEENEDVCDKIGYNFETVLVLLILHQ